jgi:hypothetical protein
MPAVRKKLCQMCFESFPEDQIVSAGAKLVCPACAERAGVRVIDFSRRAIDFGREIFRCLVADDIDKFHELFLTAEEVPLAVGETATPDHAALIRGRAERDFRSKRAHYFREPLPAEFVDFRLGPIEGGSRDVQRFGRSILRFEVGGKERTIVIQRVFNVKGKFKLEFFE